MNLFSRSDVTLSCLRVVQVLSERVLLPVVSRSDNLAAGARRAGEAHLAQRTRRKQLNSSGPMLTYYAFYILYFISIKLMEQVDNTDNQRQQLPSFDLANSPVNSSDRRTSTAQHVTF